MKSLSSSFSTTSQRLFSTAFRDFVSRRHRYGGCGFSSVSISRALSIAEAAGVSASELASAVDEAGESALHFAARFGMDGAAEALLDAGASTRLKNAAGQTPADIARGQRWGDDVGALLSAL